MNRPLRIGIMGGIRGQGFAKTLGFMKNAEFTALCETQDSSIEAIRPFMTPDTKVYRDFDEFIRSGLDGVVLANFFHEHGMYAIRAMEAGVPVLSETTAAPSLGECVDLVETQERTGVPYMLGANVLYYKAVHAMKGIIESGEAGKVLYGDAEYIHGTYADPLTDEPRPLDTQNMHWRQCMPPNMYNMHTLGPLMYVTNSMPLRVTCHMIRDVEQSRMKGRATDCVGSVVITEMDNGAVFNTTGCSYYPPTSKWFRIACEKETLETVRYNETRDKLMVVKEASDAKVIELDDVSAGIIDPDSGIDPEDVKNSTHGGLDYYNTYYFLRYLEGKKKIFFDVYRAAALSAVGILGWYSALADSREMRIPDFTCKADRDAVRGDYRKPIARRLEDLTIPCRLDEKDQFTL